MKRGREAAANPALRRILPGAGLFCLSLLLSVLAAEGKGAAIRQSLRWLEFLGVLVMAADAGSRRALSLRLVATALALAALTAGIYALWFSRPWLVRVFPGEEAPSIWTARGSVWRAAGLMHPNALAAYMYACAGVCGAFWMSRAWSAASLLSLAAAALAAAVTVLTYSKAGTLGLGLVLAGLAAGGLSAFPGRLRPLLRLGTAGAAGLVIVCLCSVPENIASQFGAARAQVVKLSALVRSGGGAGEAVREAGVHVGQAGTALKTFDDRRLMAGMVGRMAADHPWLGVGPGHYRDAAVRYSPAGMMKEGLLHHPHSLYLLVLAEQGAVGLVALAALFVLLVRGSASPGGGGRLLWWFAWAGILAAFLFQSAFEVLTVQARGMFLAFVIGFFRFPPAVDGEGE